MKIINKPTATVEQVYAWLETKNPHPLAKAMIPLFFDKATKEGIDPIVVICQAMKETGYFKYKGVLRPNFCNTCGLKGNKGGGDLDPDAHTRFEYWEDGIAAHVDHIALYAGASSYPRYSDICHSEDKNKDTLKSRGITLDPRHFTYLHGKCPNVEDLSGNWAPGKDYGQEIVRLCAEIQNTVVKPIEDKCDHSKYEDEIISLKEDIDELQKEIVSKNQIVEKYNNLKTCLQEIVK